MLLVSIHAVSTANVQLKWSAGAPSVRGTISMEINSCAVFYETETLEVMKCDIYVGLCGEEVEHKCTDTRGSRD